jgi:ATP-dependent DNA helicase RecG
MNYIEGSSVVAISTEVSTEVKLAPDKLAALLDFCVTARSRKEMQVFCGIKTDEYFRKKIVNPMLALGLLRMTIPDKPSSRFQKYQRS